MPITKHNFVVRDVEDLADTVRDAFRIAASGRPGPVLIDIPKDITAAKCEFIPKGKVEINETYEISDEELQTVADMIAASERPMIYYGGGVETSDAGDMLLQLQRKAGYSVGAHHDGHRLHPGYRAAQPRHDRHARYGFRRMGG